MRTLLVGMQASGASWVAYSITQEHEPMAAVIDLHAGKCVPKDFSEMKDCLVKYTINRDVPLRKVMLAMQPQRTILIRRNMHVLEKNLAGKWYSALAGSLQEKLAIYDDLWSRRHAIFDDAIDYEDYHPKHPIRYSLADILFTNTELSEWCQKKYTREWGFGRLRNVPKTSRDLR